MRRPDGLLAEVSCIFLEALVIDRRAVVGVEKCLRSGRIFPGNPRDALFELLPFPDIGIDYIARLNFGINAFAKHIGFFEFGEVVEIRRTCLYVPVCVTSIGLHVSSWVLLRRLKLLEAPSGSKKARA